MIDPFNISNGMLDDKEIFGLFFQFFFIIELVFRFFYFDNFFFDLFFQFLGIIWYLAYALYNLMSDLVKGVLLFAIFCWLVFFSVLSIFNFIFIFHGFVAFAFNSGFLGYMRRGIILKKLLLKFMTQYMRLEVAC